MSSNGNNQVNFVGTQPSDAVIERYYQAIFMPASKTELGMSSVSFHVAVVFVFR